MSFLASCGTYKSAYDDGIYASKEKETGTKVVVVGSKEHKEHEENYFTSEVDRLDRVNGTDILTDIDSYTSLQDEDDLLVESDTLEYTENAGSWDSGSNATVIVVNNRGFYGDYWWNWRWNRWNRWNRWGYGWNAWGWNTYGFGGFYDIYWNQGFYGGFYDPFCPPYYRYYAPFRGSRYFNNGYFRYGRRGNYLASNTRRYNTSRRNFTANTRRGFSTRRSTSTIRRSNGVRTRTNSIRSNTRPRRSTYTKPRTRTRNTYTKPRTRTRTRNYTKPRTRTRSSYTKPRTRTRTRASAPSRTRSRSSSTRSSSRSRSTSRSRGKRG
ncbi:hypothetical protein [Asprobacillus argus]|uniref:hypothetical protein n=1 Tax=Asprobacillus argus TaxID=3076534 RepID=UPI0032BFF46F